MSERSVSKDVHDIIKKLTEHHTRTDGLTDENITADSIIMSLIISSLNLMVQKIFSYFHTNGKPLLSTTQMSVTFAVGTSINHYALSLCDRKAYAHI